MDVTSPPATEAKAESAPPRTSVAPDWSKRIPALDGLRGIAILLVLLCHSVFALKTDSRILSPLIRAGALTWSGVDLFFVLSGFLIGGILLDARHSPRYFKAFYMRRVYRILPLYFLVTSILLAWYLPTHMPGPGDRPLASYFTFTQNWWLSGVPTLGVTWSLCVEEQFYLTIPFVIRYFARRQLVAVLVSIIVAAPLLRLLLHYRYPNGDRFCYILTPCRADALCLGVLAAMMVRNPYGWRVLSEKRLWLHGALLVLLGGIVYMTWDGYTPVTSPMDTLGFTWLALFYTLCLLAVVSSKKGMIHDLLCNRQLMGLGALAYCAYLIHVPSIHVGRWIVASIVNLSGNRMKLLGGMIGIAAALIVASISWNFFEKPLLKLGHKYHY